MYQWRMVELDKEFKLAEEKYPELNEGEQHSKQCEENCRGEQRAGIKTQGRTTAISGQRLSQLRVVWGHFKLRHSLSAGRP